jgi:hypothetical protein
MADPSSTTPNPGQPVEGDWLHTLGDYTKRVLAGVIASGGDPREAVSLRMGGNAGDFLPGGQMHDETQDYFEEHKNALARKTMGVEPPKNFGERAAESIGGSLTMTPFAGGPIGQVVNAGISTVLPEIAHQYIKNKYGVDTGRDEEIEGPDPQKEMDIDLAIAGVEPHVSAPFAPFVDTQKHDMTPTIDDTITRLRVEQEQADKDNEWHTTAGVAATVVAVGVASLAMKNASARAAAGRLTSIARFGDTPRIMDAAGKQLDGSLAALETGLLDRNAYAKAAMGVMDPSNADNFANSIDLVNPAALSGKMTAAYKTGELPGTTIKVTAPVDFFGSIPKVQDEAIVQAHKANLRVQGLPEDQHIISDLSDYLHAHNELDTRRAAQMKWAQGQVAAGNTLPGVLPEIRPGISHKTTAELRAIVSAGDATPAFKSILDEKNDMVDKFLQFAKQRGLIDQGDYTAMRNAFPNYVPDIEFNGPTTKWGKVLDTVKNFGLDKTDIGKMQDVQSLMTRSLEHNGGAQNPMNALDALDQYFQNMMKWADINDVRRMSMKAGEAWNSGNATEIFKRVGPDAAQAADVFKWRDGGREFYTQVKDPVFAAAIRANPLFSMPILNSWRLLRQNFITGAFAPWFALKNLIYTSTVGSLNRPNGTAFGLLDKGAQLAGFAPGIKGDPTAALTGAYGAYLGLYGHFVDGVSQTMRQSLRDNGTISKLLGPNVTDSIAKLTGDAYARSALHEMQRVGAYTGMSSASRSEVGLTSQLEKLVPKYASSYPAVRTLYNTYDAIMSSIHGGGELGYFAINRANAVTVPEVNRLAAQVRTLVGDPARSGSNTYVRALTTSTKYANITAQGLAATVSAFRKNPIQYATGIATLLGVPAVMLASRLADMPLEDRMQYFNGWTSSQRTAKIPVPIAGAHPDEWPTADIPSEIRPHWAAVMTLVDAIFGLSKGVIDAPENQGLKRVLSTMFGDMHMSDFLTTIKDQLPGLPEPMDTLTGLAGGSFKMNLPIVGDMSVPGAGENNARVMTMEGSAQQHTDPFSDTPFVNDEYSKQLYDIVQTIFGVAGQLAMDSARSYHHALGGTDSQIEGVKAGAKEMLSGIESRAPGGRVIDSESGTEMWGQRLRLSSQNIDGKVLSKKMDAMKRLEKQVQDTQKEGANAGDPPLPVRNKTVHDAGLLEIYNRVDSLKKELADLSTLRARQYAEMNSYNGADHLDTSVKRQYQNLYMTNIQKLNRLMLDRIITREQEWSQMYKTPITIEGLVGKRSLAKPGY